MSSDLITTKEFTSLRPKQRGFIVYMMGARDDQPNVPNESNSYVKGSSAYRDWDEGQFQGVLEAQDDA